MCSPSRSRACRLHVDKVRSVPVHVHHSGIDAFTFKLMIHSHEPIAPYLHGGNMGTGKQNCRRAAALTATSVLVVVHFWRWCLLLIIRGRYNHHHIYIRRARGAWNGRTEGVALWSGASAEPTTIQHHYDTTLRYDAIPCWLFYVV